MEDKMRVMTSTADGVVVKEIPTPTPQSEEVRVKVRASSINPAEEKVLSGDFVGRFLHAKTSPLVVGWDFAGTIDAIGKGVNDLTEGTAVWGHLAYSNSQKQGTFAEYITISRNSIAEIPQNVPLHIAAATPTVAMTSLQSMRDLGKLKEGGKVLIIGAGGGIGAISIGIAKQLGAHVTGVCSTKDVDRVKYLGADVVIDRKINDPLESKSAYDVIFDTPAAYSYSRCVRSLRPGGVYVTTLPNAGLIIGMVRAIFSSKKCYFVQVASKQKDLELVGKWLSEGLDVKIDSRHKIEDLDIALKRQTDPGRSGRVVVDIEDGWPILEK